MNKLRGFIFAMLLLFVVPVMVGCGGEVVIRVDSFRFDQTSYTIKKDATLQLEPVIAPVEATNKKVSYSVVSGQDYISVSETGVVTAISAGTSKIKAITDDGKFAAECTITVRNDPIVLSAPTGLVYNPSTRVISWNAVSNPENNFSASYDVSIVKDGAAPVVNTTRLTTQSITASGQYVVSVKAIGDDLLFDDSSEVEYSFEILKTPETPTVSNGILRVAMVVDSLGEIEDPTRYKLEIKKVVGGTTVELPVGDAELFNNMESPFPDQYTKTICWTIPEGISPATYQFRVKVNEAGGGMGGNVFGSGYSSTEANATFTKLAAPTSMVIEANILSWATVTGAVQYQIEVSALDAEGEILTTLEPYRQESSLGNTFNLPEDVTSLTSYAIRMRALGNDGTILSSQWSVGNAQQKLIAPTNLSVKSENGLELSWDTVDNAAEYEVFFGSTSINSDTLAIETNYSVTIGAVKYFYNENNNTLFDSMGNEPDFNDDENGNGYTIIGNKVIIPEGEYASGSPYTIAKRAILSITSTALTSLNLAVGQTNVQVRAKPIASSTSYIMSEKSASLTLTKLRAPTLSTRDGNIVWTTVSNAQSFKFKIGNTEQIFDTGHTSFVMDASYAAGGYGVSIFALGNKKEILDSEESSKNFNKLATPGNLTINSNGVISWTVSGQNFFELAITNPYAQTIASVRLSGNSYNVQSYLQGFGFGTYYFSVRALNTVASEAKINSNYSDSITTYKLGAPNELKTEGGQITWAEVPTMSVSESDNIPKSFYTYEITMGGRTFTTTSNAVLPTGLSAGNYAVQIRTIVAASNRFEASSGSVYLLPSDYASGSITATKLSTPTSLSVSGGVLSWGKVSNAENYIIKTSWKDINPSSSKTVTVAGSDSINCEISALMDEWDKDGIEYGIEYSGVCYITIQAIGTGTYLNSDSSIQAQVFKLVAPTLSVSGGQLSWSKVYSSYNNMQVVAKNYTLYVNTEADLDGGEYSISENGSSVTIVGGEYASGSPYSISEGKVIIGGVTYVVSSGKIFHEDETELIMTPDSNGNIITTSALNGFAGGNYRITVQASSGSNSGTVIASSRSESREIFKLGQINDFSGYSNSGKNNGVSWTQITATSGISVKYQFTVNEVELDNRRSLRVSQSNHIDPHYIFGDELLGSKYEFQIRATSTNNNVISGDYSSPLTVERISRVQPLSINASTVVSWSAVSGVDNYKVYIGDVELSGSKIDAGNRRITLLGSSDTSNDVLGSNDTGTFKIKVVATVNGTALDGNGKLIISAAPSETLTVVRYEEATLSANNGKLVWANSKNLTNNGYRLVFSSAGGQEVSVDLPTNSISYDMSSDSLLDNTSYSVNIIALGDGGRYLNSPTSSSLGADVIRLTAPAWRVKDGLIVWDDQIGATSYTMRTKDSLGTSKTNSGIYKTAGSSTISFLPSAASGTLNFTIQAIGSYVPTDNKFYVDSLIPTQSTVQKLAAPTGLTVRNGEIVWDSASPVISKYIVDYGERQEIIGADEEFFLSNHITSTRRNLSIRISAIGTENSVGMTQGVYISSDYCNPKTVNINARPESLSIINGELVWTNSDGNYSDYEILVTDFDGTPTTLTSTTKSSTLATLSGKFASIKVRHYGTDYGDGMSSPYVNSAYNESPLLNVEKLETPTTFIGEDGMFNWNKSVYASNSGLIMSVSVNGITTLNGATIVDSSYDLRDPNNYQSQLFRMNGYVKGSQSSEGEDARVNGTYTIVGGKVTIRGIEYTLSAGKLKDANGDEPDFNGTASGNGYTITDDSVEVEGYLYISSNLFNMSTYQFAAVQGAEIIQGLKLKWNVIGTTVAIDGVDIRNNLFIIEYKKGGESIWETMEVRDLTEIPLWLLGNYEFSISVRSYDANVIPSNPYLINTTFNKFESGDGSPTNPFIISKTTSADIVNGVALENSTAETKLGYINIIPECYFRLAEDVELTTNLAENSLLNNNMPKLYASENALYESVLTGGFDGGGYKISNYQVGRKSVNSALWGQVVGAEIEGFSEENKTATNFFGRKGVIQNINLEISKFDIDFTGQASIEDPENPGQPFIPHYVLAFIAQYVYGGWIYNCNVGLETAIFGEEGIIKDNIDCANEIYYGGIAGVVASSSADGGSFAEARLMHCTTNVKITLYKNSETLENVVRLGGIVAIANGANIYNCTNNGDLMATQVGGIALESNLVAIEGNNYLTVISGCINNGILTGLPINSSGVMHTGTVGGIVSANNAGYVIYCLNSGNINLLSGNCLVDDTDTPILNATAGGIAGGWEQLGKMINCLSTGKIILGDYLVVDKVGGLIGNNTVGIDRIVLNYSAFFDSTLAEYPAGGGGEVEGSYGKTTTDLRQPGFYTLLNTTVNAEGHHYYGVGMLKPVFVAVASGYPTINWIAD